MAKLVAPIFLLVLVASCCSSLEISKSGRPLFNSTLSKLSARRNQRLTCYTYLGCNGDHITVGTKNAPDLGKAPYLFDNKAVSCRYDGIYLLYEDIDYNINNMNAGSYAEAWGEDLCVNLANFEKKASSIRFAGAPNGYKFDTLNFYEAEFYNGREQFFYADTNEFSIDNFGRSLIVTGCIPWTLYEFKNYQGRKVCVYPSSIKDCKPGFFRDVESLIGMASATSSVRRGCYSKEKAYGATLDLTKGQAFHL